MGDLTWSFHFVRTTVVPYGVDREHIQYRQRERERGGGRGWKRERESNRTQAYTNSYTSAID